MTHLGIREFLIYKNWDRRFRFIVMFLIIVLPIQSGLEFCSESYRKPTGNGSNLFTQFSFLILIAIGSPYGTKILLIPINKIRTQLCIYTYQNTGMLLCVTKLTKFN